MKGDKYSILIECVQKYQAKLIPGGKYTIGELLVMTKEIALEAMEIYGQSFAVPVDEKWVSVGDRLPENEQTVIVCTQRGLMAQTHACYHGVFMPYGEPYITQGITHWMPLPEPPKSVPTHPTKEP